MKLVVVPVNPKAPVVLLYERHDPVVESEVRLILLLNVFQSPIERAPVVEVEASPMESPAPTRDRPLDGERIERVPCLLLKVVQSAPVSAPVVEVFAIAREKSHVPEL